jgi:hypothetical protein
VSARVGVYLLRRRSASAGLVSCWYLERHLRYRWRRSTGCASLVVRAARSAFGPSGEWSRHRYRAPHLPNPAGVPNPQLSEMTRLGAVAMTSICVGSQAEHGPPWVVWADLAIADGVAPWGSRRLTGRCGAQVGTVSTRTTRFVARRTSVTIGSTPNGGYAAPVRCCSVVRAVGAREPPRAERPDGSCSGGHVSWSDAAAESCA